MVVRVRRAGSTPPPKGDFGARVVQGELTLPSVFLPLVENSNVRSLDDLFALIDDYPSAVAMGLGWTNADVRKARRRLAEMIHQSGERSSVVASHRGEAPISRPLGARMPLDSSTPPPARTGSKGR
jgi:hypothetical protein